MGEIDMKVLQINSVCGVGSTGRIVTDIDKVLRAQGYESYIAYGRDSQSNCDLAIRIGNKFDNYTHALKTRIFDKHGFGSKRATEKLINKIDEIDPDIIHLHNIHGYYVNIELLFKYLQVINKPVVWTLHDCWAFTGHCTHFDYIGCEKWKDICNECPQKTSYPSSVLIDNSKKNFLDKKKLFTSIADMTIVTPSKWLSRLVSKSFLGKYPIEVINNGIDLDIFKPTISDFRVKYGLTNKFIILGVANVWEEKKGFNYFIELSNWLNNNEIIVMVGVTERQKKQLPDNIIGIAKTDNTKELAGIYSSADVFLNLTLEDNFPTTNLESLACGTPIITLNTGGSAECIDKGCGFTVEKENLSEILEKIMVIKKRGKTGYLHKCRRHAIIFYDKNYKFNEYINLYRSLY